jgi:hypothetical protein
MVFQPKDIKDIPIVSVSDPDPHGSTFDLSPGSRSAFPNGDPDPAADEIQ